MPETKKTFHKRPTFSAPTPPAKKAGDLVSNDQEEAEPVVEEFVDTPTQPAAPTPPTPKMVSKSHHSSAESSLDSVLSESAPTAVEADDDVLETPTQERTLNVPRKPKNDSQGAPPMNFLLVVITLFSLIFGVSGWAMYFKQAGALDLPITDQPTTTPTPGSETPAETTPTPEPAPVTLEVLNGSGVSGVAASTATKLEGLGYTVVRTGNADNQNYETTQIVLNGDFTGSEDLLAKLEAEFGSAERSEDALTGSTASARIIVGTDWTE